MNILRGQQFQSKRQLALIAGSGRVGATVDKADFSANTVAEFEDNDREVTAFMPHALAALRAGRAAEVQAQTARTNETNNINQRRTNFIGTFCL